MHFLVSSYTSWESIFTCLLTCFGRIENLFYTFFLFRVKKSNKNFENFLFLKCWAFVFLYILFFLLYFVFAYFWIFNFFYLNILFWTIEYFSIIAFILYISFYVFFFFNPFFINSYLHQEFIQKKHFKQKIIYIFLDLILTFLLFCKEEQNLQRPRAYVPRTSMSRNE